MDPLVKKVVMYVINGERLLVFRHLDFPYEETGIQVPAGTVKDNELFEVAALRELREETGKNSFEIVRGLGIEKYSMAPYRSEVQERHFYLTRTTDDLPERWQSEEEHDGLEPPTNLEFFWIPLKQGHILQSGQGALLWKVFE
jgi:8-oxo-dGTP pyrophosphatase MutT (NUDIX family)